MLRGALTQCQHKMADYCEKNNVWDQAHIRS